MAKENIKYSRGVPILQKKVSWRRYKNNYGQDIIQYSKYNAKEMSRYENAILNNYKRAQADTKNRFYRKYSGFTEDELGLKAREMKEFELFFSKNILEKAATETFKEISDQRGDMTKLLYAALNDLEDAQNKGETEMAAARQKLSEATAALDKLINVTIPAGLSRYLEGKKDVTAQDIAEAIYFETNDPAAVTSFLNSDRILQSLQGLSNGSISLGETGKMVFQKYETQVKNGIIKQKMENDGTLGDLSTVYKNTASNKEVNTRQVIGNTIAKTTAAMFEGGMRTGIAQVSERVLKQALEPLVTGAQTGEKGRSIKTDLQVKLEGKNFQLNSSGGKDKFEFDILLPDIDVNLSLKQGSISKGSTFDNSTVGGLYSYLLEEDMIDDSATLLYHYFQLHGTAQWSEDKNDMDLLNRYITSKMVQRVFGSDIDFVVFKDKSMSVYSYIQKYMVDGKKRFKIYPRYGGDMFNNIESTVTNIKN